jgi:hypothetical protein
MTFSGAEPAPQRLIFVYNADAGLLNGLKDLVHKAVSPGTYACDLCAITYDLTGMRKDWKQAIQGLPLPVEFLHRDEFSKAYPTLPGVGLPAAFSADAAGKLMPFITAAELKPLTLDKLIDLVQSRTARLPGKSIM